MSKKVNLALLGATGLVGQTVLEILEQRKFPLAEIYLLASHRSAGDTTEFKRKAHYIEDAAHFDFSKADIAIFSAGGKVSAQYAPIAAEAGCVVIDNTSQFRYEPDIPLVIPEVNPEALKRYKKRNIIANPNCSTIQMLLALKPIYDEVGIKRIEVATYQSVSGAGRKALEELVHQTGALLNGKSYDSSIFTKKIAFNVIPHIDEFMENGYTKEEMKMHWETQKIFNDSKIIVNATAVRVPVFYGHSEAIHIETQKKISAEKARELLQAAPGVKVLDAHKNGKYPTAVGDAAGTDAVWVGRIREDHSRENGLNLWVVSDNLRKGAALNAVQIAEHLIKI